MLLLIGAVWLALSLWASRRVLADPATAPGQRRLQMLVVWLLPVVGALLTLHLTRRDLEPGRGYVEPPDAGDDFGYSSRENRQFRDTLDD